jgi:hypothetical protein
VTWLAEFAASVQTGGMNSESADVGREEIVAPVDQPFTQKELVEAGLGGVVDAVCAGSESRVERISRERSFGTFTISP